MMNSGLALSLETNSSITGNFPLEKIHGIYDLCRQMVATNSLHVLLDSIVRKALDILHVRNCRILILQADGNFICQASSSTDTYQQPQNRWDRAHPQAQAFFQHVLLSNTPAFITQSGQVGADVRYALRVGYTDSLYLVPMRVNQEAVGILALTEEHTAIPDALLREKIHLAVLVADQAAGAVYRSRLSYRLEESQMQTVLALAKLMESRDEYIGRHCRRVTELAVRLANQLGCTTDESQTIRWAALLHDIGKVGIPDGILRKTGSLNKHEWKAMRRHPESGADIVRMASNLDYVAAIIMAHHERYDGAGYPNGVQREMIPFGARILAVADAYSAMTDNRPYRDSISPKDAAEEVRRCSGTQFDPCVVEAFNQLQEEGFLP
jgi:putative nucleotidyltransferase with HDIG domain